MKLKINAHYLIKEINWLGFIIKITCVLHTDICDRLKIPDLLSVNFTGI